MSERKSCRLWRHENRSLLDDQPPLDDVVVGTVAFSRASGAHPTTTPLEVKLLALVGA